MTSPAARRGLEEVVGGGVEGGGQGEGDQQHHR